MTEFTADGIDRTTTLKVSGLTCGHCVAHVTEELEALNGVKNVSVLLNKGGQSTVTVLSDARLDDATLAEAIDEAGDYTLDAVERDVVWQGGGCHPRRSSPAGGRPPRDRPPGPHRGVPDRRPPPRSRPPAPEASPRHCGDSSLLASRHRLGADGELWATGAVLTERSAVWSAGAWLAAHSSSSM